MRKLISIGLVLMATISGGRAQTDFCESLKTLGYLLPSQTGPINMVKLYGMAQYQAGYVDGTDSTGSAFSDSQGEFRRIWLGGDLRFLDAFLFKSAFSITQGKDAASGDQDIGFKHFRNLNLTVDFTKFPESSLNFKRLEIGYGRRSLKLADEWQKSATHIDVVERSAFSNKLWPTDGGGSHPVGIWMRATRGSNDVQLGVFSTTTDDVLPGWNDGTLLYGEWAHQLTGESAWDLRELVFNAFTQDAGSNEDQLARGLDWGAAAILRLHRGPWEIHTTIGGGDNGEQSNVTREGDFRGVSFMPMYWIFKDKLKFVGRYQYQESSAAQGIRLNSRYARSADARGRADLTATGGRGDRHHNLYFGLNTFFCGDNLKLVTALEYDDIQSAGRHVFRGWTTNAALRMYF